MQTKSDQPMWEKKIEVCIYKDRHFLRRFVDFQITCTLSCKYCFLFHQPTMMQLSCHKIILVLTSVALFVSDNSVIGFIPVAKFPTFHAKSSSVQTKTTSTNKLLLHPRIQSQRHSSDSNNEGEKKETTWDRITGPKLFKVR